MITLMYIRVIDLSTFRKMVFVYTAQT